jgi:hypothetical protein
LRALQCRNHLGGGPVDGYPPPLPRWAQNAAQL